MSGNERRCILNRVQQAGFAVDEAVLYLDTHPCDSNALAFYPESAGRTETGSLRIQRQNQSLTNDLVEPANRLL